MSLFSDARFRAQSVSGGDPVAIVDLSYDDPAGFYLAVSGSTVATSSGLHPLQLEVNGGYAKRMSSGMTLDLGVIHSEYSHYSNAAADRSYTELYAGLTRKYLTGRVYLSPHYFETGTWTVYGELNGNFGLAPKLSLDTHLGTLVPVRSREEAAIRPGVDWRIGLTRQLGRASVHAAWTGGRRIHHYDARPHGGSAFVIGVSYPL